ncbi:hypothetical protein D1AOALGA4SA_9855 [Olavius algarvensis Delta 1 endosymbiont]|nr:hypothetical protein D1AOALGA4SA_9855 [Olavius algarvensis Delta 1 endosymbiont]
MVFGRILTICQLKAKIVKATIICPGNLLVLDPGNFTI